MNEKIPLIIAIYEKGLISIYTFNLNFKDMFKPILLWKGFVINNKYIMTENVFGLKSSALSGNKNDEKCIICMDNDKNVIIWPCNHMCLCDECAD